MRPVSRVSEVEANIRLLSSYLAAGRRTEVDFAKALIQRGICFVVAQLRDGPFFAPSRFVGYAANSRRAHQQNRWKHGGETNQALIDLTGSRPKHNQRLEREYQAFCAKLGVCPRPAGSFGVVRQFWDLR